MDVKKIYHKIQERIALDNLKTDVKNRKNRKKVIIALSTIGVIFAGLVTAKIIEKKNESL